MTVIEITLTSSQSPENGSRLCKLGGALPSGGREHLPSQSPENGSRLCKGGLGAGGAGGGGRPVAIP